MRTLLSASFRLAATALACAAALTAGVSHAENYFAVLPLLGADASQAKRPVKMVLASVTPPVATVGVPYRFNLGALLSLDGPEGTSPSNVHWSVVSGELPPGMSLVGDEVVGTPTEPVVGRQVVIQAEHVSGYGTDSVSTDYSFAVAPAEIVDFGGYRAWADGTFAQSCEGYIRSGSESYPYQGAVGDGVYRISPAGSVMDVYCDQTTDSGGWVLLMKQAAHDGETLQGDTHYWTQGTILNDTSQGRSMADGNFVSPAFATLPVASFRLQAANEVMIQRSPDGLGLKTGLLAFSDSNRVEYSDPTGTIEPSIPSWYIYADKYPNLDFNPDVLPGGAPIKSARFGFNFRESGYTKAGSFVTCAVRWGWAADENTNSTVGTHDACGGLGGYGSQYGALAMGYDKNIWQPATLYLWGR